MWWHVLTQPIHQAQTVFKKLAVLHRQVSLGNGCTPLKLTTVSLQVVVDDLKEVGYRQWVFTQNGNFLAFVHTEGCFIKQLTAFYGRRKIFYVQDLVTHL